MKSSLFLGVLIAGNLAGIAALAAIPAAPAVQTAISLASAKPDAHGIRRMAVLRGLDKITGRATEIDAPAGVPVRFGTLTITVQYCHTVPPEEPPETTAFLQIDESELREGAKKLFSGWMFASTPALNALEHPVYDVWVVTCKTDEPTRASSTSAAASADRNPQTVKPAPGSSPTKGTATAPLATAGTEESGRDLGASKE